MKAACLANQMTCVVQAGAATCQACGQGQAVDTSGACVAITGTALTHDFDAFTVTAGEELLGMCESWTLGNATELWVSTVELTQAEGLHHSNWLFVPNTTYDGPDGLWKCSDRGYDQQSASLAGGVLYAQSTQATHEVQRFPGGAAVRIPPYSRIVGDIHVLNASTKSITGGARLSLYSLAACEVKVKLAPFHAVLLALDIPPHGSARNFAECDAGDQFLAATGKPWDLKIYFMLPHTHTLATRFFVDGVGGAVDGKSLLELGSYNGEPHGRSYDPPLDLTGASGIRFGCEYNNPGDETIGWGYGNQEMCEVLGFAETTQQFESSVTKVAAAGSAGSMALFTGGCGNVLVPWNPNQAGGTGP